MIIDTTADIHYSREGSPEHAKALADRVIADCPDVFMILGDIAVEYADFHKCLRNFDSFKGTKLAVLGNHDIWVVDNINDSYQKAKKVTEILKEHGFQVLDEKPVVIDKDGKKTAFVGNIGWYDYSFFKRELMPKSNEDYEKQLEEKIFNYINEKGELKTTGWNDGFFAIWGKSDKEKTDELADKLEKDLQTVYESADNIIVAMHHPPFESLVIRKPHNPYWEFNNAYMGSKKFGEVIQKYNKEGKIKKVLSGHTHRIKEVDEDNVPCATVYCNPSKLEPYKIRL